MDMHSCRNLLRGLTAALAFLTLTTPLFAQTALQPSVRGRQHGGLHYEVVPGDFNGDSKVDLSGRYWAPGSEESELVIALGNGDGTFAPPQRSAITVMPLAVEDFDRDEKLDVVTVTTFMDGPADLHVSFGNGDGTVEPGRVVSTSLAGPSFALTGDFDGDGNFDIVAPAMRPGR